MYVLHFQEKEINLLPMIYPKQIAHKVNGKRIDLQNTQRHCSQLDL